MKLPDVYRFGSSESEQQLKSWLETASAEDRYPGSVVGNSDQSARLAQIADINLKVAGRSTGLVVLDQPSTSIDGCAGSRDTPQRPPQPATIGAKRFFRRFHDESLTSPLTYPTGS